MIQSRHEFLKEILDYVGHADDPGAYDTMERLLNVCLQTLWGKRAWRAFLHPTPYELSTAVGTHNYALPDWFGRVSGDDGVIRNLTTGERLYPTTRAIVEAERPWYGTSLDTNDAPPLRYFFNGVMPVHTQPAVGGSFLEVLSSDAADVEISAVIAGVTVDGEWTRTQVTLTGTTPVALGSWKEIHEFGKSYPNGVTPVTELTSSRGTVTLRIDSPVTVLQTLLPHESSRAVQVIAFDPTPDAVYVIGVPFIRAVQKLWRAGDSLPFGWGPALREECLIEWQVNAGMLTLAAAATTPRPKLLDLICSENAAAAQQQRRRAPYGGR